MEQKAKASRIVLLVLILLCHAVSIFFIFSNVVEVVNALNAKSTLFSQSSILTNSQIIFYCSSIVIVLLGFMVFTILQLKKGKALSAVLLSVFAVLISIISMVIENFLYIKV